MHRELDVDAWILRSTHHYLRFPALFSCNRDISLVLHGFWCMITSFLVWKGLGTAELM